MNNDAMKSLNRTFEETEFSPDLDYEAVVYDLYKIYLTKNSDYDESFDYSMDKHGYTTADVRLGDKYKRFEKLVSSGERLVADETIEDTLMDMANYAIMTLRWARLQKNKDEDNG